MVKNFLESDATCPKCKSKFKYDVSSFSLDKKLICPNCDFVFTLREAMSISSNKFFKQLNDVIENEIKENNKGNINISKNELDKLKRTRNKLKKLIG